MTQIPIPRQPHLAPDAVAAEIAAGGDANRAFAQLDLNQCQFHDRVDTSGYTGPTIPMQGFGGVAKGQLAFSPQAAKTYEENGQPTVRVFTEHAHNYENLIPPRNAIFDGSGTTASLFSRPDHLRANLETSSMTWLKSPAIIHQAGTHTISLYGVTLHEGDWITLDGHEGSLYPTDLPVAPVPYIIAGLDSVSEKALPRFEVLASALDNSSMSGAILSTAEGTGLFRSENIFRDCLALMANRSIDENALNEEEEKERLRHDLAYAIYSKLHAQKIFRNLLDDNANTPVLLEDLKGLLQNRIEAEIVRACRGANHKRPVPRDEFPLTYRLADPEVFRTEIDDAYPITSKAKKRLYAVQAEALFACVSYPNLPLSILVPSVKSAEELAEIKAEVDKAAKAHGFMDEAGKRRFKFGAMMETKEAVKPEEAAKIARLCDFVSFGTNDLTKDITGLKRDDLDTEHQKSCKRWMAEHGCQNLGASPFDVLVPLVTRSMKFATDAMRKANPDIKIGCCGRQVAANAPSIQACMKMGLDNIVVPPQDIAASRIMAAHYAARQAVGLERARS